MVPILEAEVSSCRIVVFSQSEQLILPRKTQDEGRGFSGAGISCTYPILAAWSDAFPPNYLYIFLLYIFYRGWRTGKGPTWSWAKELTN